MLDFMRRGSKSWAAKGLLIAVAASFIIGFGILPTIRKFTGVDDSTIATVNGTRIPVTEFERQRERLYDRYREQQIPEKLLASMNLEETLLTSLIQKTLLLQAARKMRIVVPDSALVESIRSEKLFQEKSGNFSRSRYLNVCRAQGIEPATYEEELREQLTIQFLEEIVTLSAQVSEDEVKDWMRVRSEQVSLDALSYAPAQFLQKDEPIPEDEAKVYFEAHKADFKMPPLANVEFLTLKDETVEKGEKVTDEEVRGAWKPKEAKLREILLKLPAGANEEKQNEIRRKAEDIAAKIHDGADFAATAKSETENEKAKDSGGDLGWLTRTQMDRWLEKPVFEANAGSLVGPVQGPGGFHVLRVEEFKPPYEPEKIRKTLMKERVEKAGLAQAKDLRLEITQKTDFKAFADEHGLAHGTAASIPMDGTGEIAGSRALADAAAAMKGAGEIGMPVRIVGGYSIPKLAGRQPERDRTLEEARPMVDDALRDAHSRDRAKAAAEQALSRLRDGKLPAQIAKETGTGEFLTTDLFHRLAETIPKIGASREMVEAAFTLTDEAPVAAKVLEVGEKFYATHLHSRTSSEPSITTAEGRADHEGIVKNLLSTRQSERMKEWLDMLTQTSRIHVNEDLVKSFARPTSPMPAS